MPYINFFNYFFIHIYFNCYNKWGGIGLSSSVDKIQDKRWDGLGSSSKYKKKPNGP